MSSPLIFAVIWFCLAGMAGVINLFKPHVYFLVAGSFASVISIMFLLMHLLVSHKNLDD